MTSDAGVLFVGLATIAVFSVAFYYSGLVTRARAVISLTSQTMASMAEKSLDDEEKERLVQSAALRLFGHFGMITLIAIIILAISGLVMWVGDFLGLAPFAAVSDFLLSWEVIIGMTLLIIAVFWLVKRF